MKHVNLITRQLCSQFYVKLSYNIKLRLVKNYKTSEQILMKLNFMNHKSKNLYFQNNIYGRHNSINNVNTKSITL